MMHSGSTARLGKVTLCVVASALALAACSKEAEDTSSADAIPTDTATTA